MKIFITGGSGLVGSQLVSYLKRKNYQIFAPLKRELDITDKNRVHNFFEQVKPDIVIHSAAVAGILKAESERGDKGGKVWKVNVLGTENIALECKAFGSYLIFFSAEVVFSGSKPIRGPYKETDRPGRQEELSWYGFSKRTSEKYIEKKLEKSAIVRLCSVVGSKKKHKKPDYAQKIILSFEKGQLEPKFIDQYIGITDIDDVCKAVYKLCHFKLAGIFHIASVDVCTPFDFSEFVLLKTKGVTGAVKGIKISQFLRKRPNTFGQFLGLNCEKTARTLGMNFKTWKEIGDKSLS